MQQMQQTPQAQGPSLPPNPTALQAAAAPPTPQSASPEAATQVGTLSPVLSPPFASPTQPEAPAAPGIPVTPMTPPRPATATSGQLPDSGKDYTLAKPRLLPIVDPNSGQTIDTLTMNFQPRKPSTHLQI